MNIYIKEVIKAKGMQLQQISEKIGYKSLPSFYRQINEPEKISMRTLLKIAEAADCEVNDFFIKPVGVNEINHITALVDYNGTLYRADNIGELEMVVEKIKTAENERK